MKREHEEIAIKIAGTALVLAFVYYLARRNGGTLAGNPEGYRVKLDTSKLINAALTGVQLAPSAIRSLRSATRWVAAQNPWGVET